VDWREARKASPDGQWRRMTLWPRTPVRSSHRHRALETCPNFVDLPCLGVDKDDRHIGRVTRLVLDPEGNGPEAARRNAPTQEPDVVPLGREADFRTGDLNRPLLAH